jgi:hypothetical protein
MYIHYSQGADEVAHGHPHYAGITTLHEFHWLKFGMLDGICASLIERIAA